MPLQAWKALKLPSGSSQDLLLCAGKALLVALACAEEDLELLGPLSPPLLHGCIPASPLLLQVQPGRSPMALISAALQ